MKLSKHCSILYPDSCWQGLDSFIIPGYYSANQIHSNSLIDQSGYTTWQPGLVSVGFTPSMWVPIILSSDIRKAFRSVWIQFRPNHQTGSSNCLSFFFSTFFFLKVSKQSKQMNKVECRVFRFHTAKWKSKHPGKQSESNFAFILADKICDD